MSRKIHDIKSQEVSLLVKELESCQSFLVFEYAGFTAKESSQLRSDLHQAGFKLKVYKNNILNRALSQSKIHENSEFVGPNALAYGNEDIEPLKKIAKMADKKTFIKLKAAYVDKNLMLGDSLKNFATLPTKKDLYAMFCQCLQAPLRKFMHVIKAVGEKKQA